MNKKKKEKIIIYTMSVILLFIVAWIIFSFVLMNNDKYNYKFIKGNSYVAQDGSYLVLNDDKTFYWYIDKESKNDYYYGRYNVYRGNYAVKYITSELSIYGITEEEQRQTINNIDIKNAIDHYYLITIINEKVVIDGKENSIFKETRYYGFATEDYNELDLLNVDANNYAIFIKDN